MVFGTIFLDNFLLFSNLPHGVARLNGAGLWNLIMYSLKSAYQPPLISRFSSMAGVWYSYPLRHDNSRTSGKVKPIGGSPFYRVFRIANDGKSMISRLSPMSKLFCSSLFSSVHFVVMYHLSSCMQVASSSGLIENIICKTRWIWRWRRFCLLLPSLVLSSMRSQLSHIQLIHNFHLLRACQLLIHTHFLCRRLPQHHPSATLCQMHPSGSP